MMKLIGACATDIGTTREVNQDAILYRAAGKGANQFAVLAVCDGIGGLDRGEIASGIVMRGINTWFEDVMTWIDIGTVEEAVLYAHLKDMADQLNSAVWEYREENGIHTGTTMSLLMIIRNSYFIIQVGDSRVYSFYDGELCQLTVDASVSRLKDGRMKSYLDNYMGKDAELWFSTVSGEIRKDEMFLACSDGLYHRLTREDAQDLYNAMANDKKAEVMCGELIKRMMERGERDNISAGAIRVMEKKNFFK